MKVNFIRVELLAGDSGKVSASNVIQLSDFNSMQCKMEVHVSLLAVRRLWHSFSYFPYNLLHLQAYNNRSRRLSHDLHLSDLFSAFSFPLHHLIFLPVFKGIYNYSGPNQIVKGNLS